MVWNRELSSFFVTFLMIISLIFLIVRRKNLGKSIGYFIAAFSILTAIEICTDFLFFIRDRYNFFAFYAIGVNFFVFFLYFLYFHHILQRKILKKINLIIISVFVVSYLLFAIFVDDFFTKLHIFSYFTEAILLLGSIYLVMSQTFNSDNILKLNRYFPFWVCISLLLIYLGVLPLLVVSNIATSKMNLNIFFATLFLINTIGYSILLFGIFKSKSGD